MLTMTQVPGGLDPATGKKRRPFGLALHTTGRGLPDKAIRKGVPPLTLALQTYLRSQRGELHPYRWGGPTYVLDYDGALYQLAPDEIQTAHCGGPHRSWYLSGRWRDEVSPATLEHWQAAWPGVASPQHLYPTRSANEAYCLDPNMRVLTADLNWVPLGDIQVGRRLVAFSETLSPHNCYEPATVTFATMLRKRRLRVITTHGDLVCSEDHMFAATPGPGGRSRWMRADALRRNSRIRYAMTPWERDDSYDGGWLAGMIDGEGSWAKSGELVVTQKAGVVLDRLMTVLASKGIDADLRRKTSGDCHYISLRGVGTGLSHVGRFQPVRMIGKAEGHWSGRRIHGKLTPRPLVIAVEPLPDGDVAAIKTTTRTFIAEGFLSHNCGVEMLPIVRGNRDPSVAPFRPGLLFTQAQHDSAAALYRLLRERHGWPEGPPGPRLVGHEDVQPIERHDKGGGWDPGSRRARPYWDDAYVRAGCG